MNPIGRWTVMAVFSTGILIMYAFFLSENEKLYYWKETCL